MRAVTQERIHTFVRGEVFENQTMLVDELFSQEIFFWEDIENYYEDPEDMDDDDACLPKQIFEWWVVSDRIAGLLKQQGEAILENDYGLWWGRSCCGQAIYLDGVIEDIVSQIKHVA